MSRSDNPDWSFDTLAVRAGQERSQFNEHSEALYLTSSFVFENAAQAAARFSGAEPGNVYARFTNPTVTAMQERLAALEGAEACIATATGMAAILSTVMALMKAGEHIVASRSIFGATSNCSATSCRASASTPALSTRTRSKAFAPRCARTPSWSSSKRRRTR
jgi:O-succinylhomoserine sulfhydrylase